jgi:hypothetical protein
VTETTTAPATRNAIIAPHRSASILTLCIVGAAMAGTSGGIHLYLWNHFYRHNAYAQEHHMNTLFLVQWILCFLGVLALLVMRNLLASIATAALLTGTFIGYLIARYHGGGLFGFDLPSDFGSWEATWSMIVEIIGAVALVVTAGLMARGTRGGATA